MKEAEYPPLTQQHIRMIRDLRWALGAVVDHCKRDLPRDVELLAKAALFDAREPLVP